MNNEVAGSTLTVILIKKKSKKREHLMLTNPLKFFFFFTLFFLLFFNRQDVPALGATRVDWKKTDILLKRFWLPIYSSEASF